MVNRNFPGSLFVPVFLGLLLATGGIVVPIDVAALGPEDQASEGGEPVPSDAVSEIPALTVAHVVLDFGLMPQGATSLAAIRAAFPGSTLIGLTFATRAGTGTYDFQTGGGRALAPNPDGSAGLYLVNPPTGTYGEADSLAITLDRHVTQFGFEIGDWSGPFFAEVFSGAVSLGEVEVSTASDNRTHFLESTDEFNRVVLTALPDNPQANWVVPALYIPEQSPAPAPALSHPALVLLVLVLLASGLWALRRRRALFRDSTA